MPDLHIIKGANVYLEGKSRLGQAAEFVLPNVTQTMTEFKGMGMIGVVSLPIGLDKLEATLKWAGPYVDAKTLLADPHTVRTLMLMGSIDVFDATGRIAERPVLAEVRAMGAEEQGGGYKMAENTEYESKLNVLYYDLKMEGKPIVKVDLINMIYEVGGKDQLAGYKANLGV
jgi:P2 family phage contractile tail tube protein